MLTYLHKYAYSSFSFSVFSFSLHCISWKSDLNYNSAFCLLAQFKLKVDGGGAIKVRVIVRKRDEREASVCDCLESASFTGIFFLFVSVVGLSDKPTGRLTVCEQCCVCFRGQTEYAIRVWGLQSRTTLTLPPNRTKTVQLWMQTHSLNAGQHCAIHHELLSAVVSNELMSWQALWCFQKEMTLSHVLWWAPAQKERNGGRI